MTSVSRNSSQRKSAGRYSAPQLAMSDLRLSIVAGESILVAITAGGGRNGSSTTGRVRRHRRTSRTAGNASKGRGARARSTPSAGPLRLGCTARPASCPASPSSPASRLGATDAQALVYRACVAGGVRTRIEERGSRSVQPSTGPGQLQTTEAADGMPVISGRADSEYGCVASEPSAPRQLVGRRRFWPCKRRTRATRPTTPYFE